MSACTARRGNGRMGLLLGLFRWVFPGGNGLFVRVYLISKPFFVVRVDITAPLRIMYVTNTLRALDPLKIQMLTSLSSFCIICVILSDKIVREIKLI